MKKIKILCFLLLFTILSTFAQSEKIEDKKEQIKAMKIAFLTTELNLNKTESEKFWPIYTVFDEKQFGLIQKKIKMYFKKLESTSGKIDENEALALLNQMETTEDDLYRLRKKFVAEIKKFLPASKIIKLRKSEDDFNRKLLRQYREMKK